MAPSATEYLNISYENLIILKQKRITLQNNGAEYGKILVQNALKEHVAAIDPATCEPGDEDAFFVADMGEVYRQHLRWKLNLPRVKPHYGEFLRYNNILPWLIMFVSAVKCNPDLEVLRLLAALGNGFDCASKAEIDQVLKLGIEPSRIIYAQPCKTTSHIRHAARLGVKQMTFDNSDELYKIKELFPNAELYLRILTDDSSSLCRLSLKFGASLDCTEDLLRLAKGLELNVVGISFHVGSGASDPQSFIKAVQDARLVFDQASLLGYDLKTLDVGGGFTSDPLFENMAFVLSNALDDHFPSSIRIIGEPGRYFVSNAYTLACNVIARRDIMDAFTQKNTYMLYLNDGVYGNFSSIIFDHQHPIPNILSAQNGHEARSTVEYSIWGPTCDGIDRITETSTFRCLLDIGDWLYFEEMGAYTKCSATRFNGFTNDHQVIYISSEAGASAILGY